MKKTRLFGAIAVLLVSLGAGGYFYYRYAHPFLYETHLKTALQAVQNPQGYQMSSQTHTEISGRKIDITGLYSLDFKNRAYSAISTTTLTIPEEKPGKRVHSFSLENVVVGDDVYVRIRTQSPLLKKTVPDAKDWRHFTKDAIPDSFKDVAIPGPVLDDLALLSGEGRYLKPLHSSEDRSIGDEHFAVYSFTLTDKARAVRGGTLQTLVGRIATGTVELWLDKDDSLRQMIVHGDNYDATSTLLHVNTQLQITAPSLAGL